MQEISFKPHILKKSGTSNGGLADIDALLKERAKGQLEGAEEVGVSERGGGSML